MAEDWSRLEVEATVEDYFSMWADELRGRDYNKSAHRRNLAKLLDSRSHGAIERKHQNISAILIELGLPYIEGYKPLGNYQGLLSEVVVERLENHGDLLKLIESQVAEPAELPEVDDILAAMVDPPKPTKRLYSQTREKPRTRRGVDYLAREARNRSLGAAGEAFVLRFETARLIHLGEERLASKVEHVSRTRGDGAGFDILSFDASGKERLIEVKTTAYGPLTPFFVSRNEVEVSRESEDHYHLYRTFGFRRNPRLYTRSGRLDRSFELDPSQFMARIA